MNLKNRKGKQHNCWKGGRIFRGKYIYIHLPKHPFCGKQGYFAEHRLVMEKKIGRYLTKNEVVHHIDENPANNHSDNLQLFSSPGEHTRIAHPEILEANSARNKGKHLSPKTEFKKGFAPWNKGKKGVMAIPWNKGMKIDKIKYPNFGGKSKSIETRNKISKALMGNIPWNKGIKTKI